MKGMKGKRMCLLRDVSKQESKRLQMTLSWSERP